MIRIVGLALMVTSILTTAMPMESMALSLEALDRRILSCNQVLKRVLEMPDRGIPKDLIQRCRGLAIFPGLVKAGVVIGVSFGNGIILRRDENTAEWTRPVFFKIRGASLGFQAGAQFTDLILLVMSEQGVQGLLEDRLILGADVSVAVGPADTGWTFYVPYSVKTQQNVLLPMTAAFILGWSSILTGVNFVTTAHRLRVKGMGWFQMPLFIWI